ncbi:hypothetical protein D3C84_749080 [compost metagenome]
MTEVKRYYVGNNPKLLGGYGLVEMSRQYADETGFRGIVTGEDFDRVVAERDALQLRLNVADQRNDDLVAAVRENHEWHKLYDEHDGYAESGLYETNIAALKPSTESCQFPQSCTTRCDCDIPDFSQGNGNKARRRAEALFGFKVVEDPTLAPGEIKLVQPAKCVDPFSMCLDCFGAGTICTGIAEASSTICNGCNGTGREKP